MYQALQEKKNVCWVHSDSSSVTILKIVGGNVYFGSISLEEALELFRISINVNDVNHNNICTRIRRAFFDDVSLVILDGNGSEQFLDMAGGFQRVVICCFSYAHDIKSNGGHYNKIKEYYIPSWTSEEYYNAMETYLTSSDREAIKHFFLEKFINKSTDGNWDIKQKDFEEQFYFSGGCPRWMLWSKEDVKDLINTAIDKLRNASEVFSGLNARDSASINRLMALKLIPMSSSKLISPVSKYATKSLLKKYKGVFLKEAINHLGGNPSALGFVVENTFIWYVCSGKEESLTGLNSLPNTVPKYLFTMSQTIYFKVSTNEQITVTSIDGSLTGTVFIPLRDNQGCFDVVLVKDKTLYFVNVTISQTTKTYKLSHIETFLRRLQVDGKAIVGIVADIDTNARASRYSPPPPKYSLVDGWKIELIEVTYVGYLNGPTRTFDMQTVTLDEVRNLASNNELSRYSY